MQICPCVFRQHLLLQTISSLEKDIAGLKKEIGERDETIGDKEKRIYDLKKKNQVCFSPHALSQIKLLSVLACPVSNSRYLLDFNIKHTPLCLVCHSDMMKHLDKWVLVIFYCHGG